MSDAITQARADAANLPGLKEDELIAAGPCRICGKPLLAPADGGPSFYVVTVKRALFDPIAIQRRAGLQMQLGSGPLARAMGPNEDLAKIFDGPHTAVVHETCGDRINSLLELIAEKEGRS